MEFRGLNDKQIKAVRHTEGSILILAGAGSGKTTTMTHRIAYMIEKGISPYNILAVTFTNKAAGEMRDRVEKLTDNTAGMWIMTFHAMSLRMLRYHGERLGYKKGFTVYDETDKKSLIKRIYKEMNIDEKMYPLSGVISEISHAKEREEDAEKYMSINGGDCRGVKIGEIYSEYQRRLRKNNAMDFDDLLLNGLKLLKKDKRVLEHYQDRFKYIMVDEYQDTNYLQYEIIRLLASKNRNLCVVGDDDQCIYQWRGADIRNILEFEQDFKDAVVIKLEQNYRSDANILNLANSVIKNNKGRKSKSLWTDRDSGEKITYKRCDDEKREAWYIGSEIENLHSEGFNYGDIAILYRKNAQSRSFEEKFAFRGIPYKVLAGIRFYDRKEIKDVISYLRLIENPDEDVAMLRVINEPKRGIGAKTLAGIEAYAGANAISIYDALCSETVKENMPRKAKAEIDSFLNMIEGCRKEIDNLTLSALYDNVLNRSGYLAALEAADSIEADARIENIMELKSVIAEFENGGANAAGAGDEELREEQEILAEEGFDVPAQTNLGAFLERIALMSDIDNADDSDDAVTLMTLHSAKGLEFPVVFIPGMENGIFPGAASFDDPSKLEEERRLCYVGITRAKKKLYLTGAKMRTMYGKTDWQMESIFLDEMNSKLMDGDITINDRVESSAGFRSDGGIMGGHKFVGSIRGSADGYYGEPRNKPFDSLAYSKKSTKKSISNEGFKVGDELLHPKFGKGMLIDQDEKTMTVIFDSVGRKKLGKGFVELEHV